MLVSLVKRDKYNEVADGHFVTGKQPGKVQIKMPADSGKFCIAMLYNTLFAPELCD